VFSYVKCPCHYIDCAGGQSVGPDVPSTHEILTMNTFVHFKVATRLMLLGKRVTSCPKNPTRRVIYRVDKMQRFLSLMHVVKRNRCAGLRTRGV